MNHREVMQQALDYIVTTNKSSQFWLVPNSNLNKTVAALRAALAEPQDEPVAFAFRHSDGSWHDISETEHSAGMTALYTHPAPQRQPLIADEICDSWEFITGHQIQFGPSSEGRPMYLSADEVIEFARAIEAAHEIGGQDE